MREGRQGPEGEGRDDGAWCRSYPTQKFDSDPERRFAVVLEKDPAVSKWFKPGIAYQKCIDDAEICVRGNTPGGGCVMGCEQGWPVECKPSPGALTCICTSGRSTGRQFMAAACQSEEWLKTIRSVCQ